MLDEASHVDEGADLVEQEPPRLPLEVLSPTPALAEGLAGPAGGTLSAGDLLLEVPPDALDAPTPFSLALHSPDDVHPDDPPGLILARLTITPWSPQIVRPVTVTVPLSRRLEPGMPLEMIGYNPGMRGNIVIAFGVVDASGTAVRMVTRQLGRMVVRAHPIVDEAARAQCPERNLRVREMWPGPTEAATVGLVEIVDRTPRDLAFNVLSDIRRAPWLAQVEVKNEEVFESLATRRIETDHTDEDYLFDPHAAAALEVVAALVLRDWRDPLTGGPAYRVRVTEGFDALIEHSQRSTHYQGRAVDLTLSPIPAANGEERRELYGRLSRLATCAGFDYVLFEDIAHVHVSVVPAQIAMLTRDDERSTLWAASLVAPTDLTVIERGPANLPDGAFVAFGPRGPRIDRTGGTRPAYLVAVDPAESDELQLVRRVSAPVRSSLSADGRKQLVVQGGRAWLVNPEGLAPPGAVDGRERPTAITYPYALDAPGEVIDARFVPHLPTEVARARFLTP